MIFSQILCCICTFVVIIASQPLDYKSSGFLSMFPDENLNSWQMRCLDVHNKLRYAHKSKQIKYNTLFSDMATDRAYSRALRFKMSSNIRAPMFLLNPDDVSYEQTEDETKVPLQVIFRPELFPEFLAGKVQSILYDWFMSGYFQVKQNSTAYMNMIDSSVEMIGCGLKVNVKSATRISLSFVVAYYHKKNPDKTLNTTSFEGLQQQDPATTLSSELENLPRPYPDRSCQSNCHGSCCSLKFSDDDRQQPRCTCNKKFFLGVAPTCTGNCFVMCPNARDEHARSCYGRNKCFCSFNRAVCS